MPCADIAKKCEEHQLQNSTCLGFLTEERSKQKETEEVSSACFKYLICFWTKLSAGSAQTWKKLETRSRDTGFPSLTEEKQILSVVWKCNSLEIICV